MKETISVRVAWPEDAPVVRSVIERAIRLSTIDLYSSTQREVWASGSSVDAVRLMIQQSFALVAEVDHRIVGFTTLVDSEVDQLYVDPDFGGRGISRMLYETLETEAWSRGLEYLTATASLRARPVFEAFGFFAVEGIERQFNGASFPVVLMRKDRMVTS